MVRPNGFPGPTQELASAPLSWCMLYDDNDVDDDDDVEDEDEDDVVDDDDDDDDNIT